jgi:hypothetical protein
MPDDALWWPCGQRSLTTWRSASYAASHDPAAPASPLASASRCLAEAYVISLYSTAVPSRVQVSTNPIGAGVGVGVGKGVDGGLGVGGPGLESGALTVGTGVGVGVGVGIGIGVGVGSGVSVGVLVAIAVGVAASAIGVGVGVGVASGVGVRALVGVAVSSSPSIAGPGPCANSPTPQPTTANTTINKIAPRSRQRPVFLMGKPPTRTPLYQSGRAPERALCIRSVWIEGSSPA